MLGLSEPFLSSAIDPSIYISTMLGSTSIPYQVGRFGSGHIAPSMPLCEDPHTNYAGLMLVFLCIEEALDKWKLEALITFHSTLHRLVHLFLQMHFLWCIIPIAHMVLRDGVLPLGMLFPHLPVPLCWEVTFLRMFLGVNPSISLIIMAM